MVTGRRRRSGRPGAAPSLASRRRTPAAARPCRGRRERRSGVRSPEQRCRTRRDSASSCLVSRAAYDAGGCRRGPGRHDRPDELDPSRCHAAGRRRASGWRRTIGSVSGAVTATTLRLAASGTCSTELEAVWTHRAYGGERIEPVEPVRRGERRSWTRASEGVDGATGSARAEQPPSSTRGRPSRARMRDMTSFPSRDDRTIQRVGAGCARNGVRRELWTTCWHG